MHQELNLRKSFCPSPHADRSLCHFSQCLPAFFSPYILHVLLIHFVTSLGKKAGKGIFLLSSLIFSLHQVLLTFNSLFTGV